MQSETDLTRWNDIVTSRKRALAASLPAGAFSAFRVSAAWLAFGVLAWPHVAFAQSGSTVDIRSQSMAVTLDRDFPRVLNYRTAAGRSVPGADPEQRPTLELNGQIYSPGDFEVRVQPQASSAEYSIRVRPLDLDLHINLAVNGSELAFELARVGERGSFRLQTLVFPDQSLVRIPAADGEGEAYRGEYEGRAWKEPYPNIIGQSTAKFMTIGRENGGLPKETNWASANLRDVAVTIDTNIPFWRVRTRLLGGEGTATDFTMGVGTYQYRILGEPQPLLKATVAILTEDVNADGVVNWMDAAIWHRGRLPAPNAVFEPGRFTYKILNDWVKPVDEPAAGFAPPVTSFAQSLDLIREVARVTRNAGQNVALTGWQFTGHDTGFPALNRVNERVGGAPELRKLIKGAERYNAKISYHININDSYPGRPGFNPEVLQFDRSGKPFVWSYQFVGAPPDYRVSLTKQFRSGDFQRRIEEMTRAVPLKDIIFLDTFRSDVISIGPGEDIGYGAEAQYGRDIIDWFHQRGIAVSIEGPEDGFFGKVDHILHRHVLSDPFEALMLHGKVYGSGRYESGPGQVLGWSNNDDYLASDVQLLGWAEKKKYTAAQIGDWYYLGNLTQAYLTRRELLWLGSEKAGVKTVDGKTVPLENFVGRFADGTVSRVTHDGYWTVMTGGVPIVEGTRRMIPLSDSEVILYSVEPGTSQWQLPSSWKGANVKVNAVGKEPTEARAIRATDGTIFLSLEARQAYVVNRLP